MARKRKGRDVHGILLLDKPTGISSNKALQRVKHLFQAKKAGHTGSLDNLASGLLPICLGEATKIAGFLLDADKQYYTVLTLGVTTDTGDAEGNVITTQATDNITQVQINNVLQQFMGEIEQVPPMYSALKYQGQALYKLARQGKTVERKARRITIFSIQQESFKDNHLALTVHCSKGTYIRSLAEDIGNALGCGAHVSVLRRLSVGQYRHMMDFETLETYAQQGVENLDEQLIPMEDALPHFPSVTLTESYAYYVRQGQAVQIAHAPTEGWVKLLVRQADDAITFIGMGIILEDGRVAPKRLLTNM